MRLDIQFSSGGVTCRGWLYRPPGWSPEGRVPAVVMAHGFSATKEMSLPSFAERFAAAGCAVVVFDYRFLGASDGEPRGQILPYAQLEDFRNAITWASGQPGIDPERIGVWGTSFSGGHVFELASFDPRVKVAVAQVPLVSAWRQILRSQGREALDLFLQMAAADRRARLETGTVSYIPVVAPEGEAAALATPDAYAWFTKADPTALQNWENRVTIESLEHMAAYDPTHAIELIAPKPLLVIAAARDALIPIETVREVFSRAGEPKELLELDCEHFGVYETEPWFERASSAATTWFEKYLGT